MKTNHGLHEIHSSSLFMRGGNADELYSIAMRDGGLCIDGGAAAGSVTKLLLESPKTKVIAFEPFPGNHPYYNLAVGECSRAVFYPVALGAINGSGSFYIRRVVDGNQKGWNHMQGYSSEGFLTQDNSGCPSGTTLEVKIVRLEDYIDETVTLLKLDLQGGEYDALIGLGSKVGMLKYCLVEFSLDWRIVDFFAENGFVLFDTNYTGIPKVPIKSLQDHFLKMTTLDLSNGSQAVSGILKNTPRDLQGYRDFIEGIKEKFFHHLWSDLVAVNQRYLRDFFLSAL